MLYSNKYFLNYLDAYGLPQTPLHSIPSTNLFAMPLIFRYGADIIDCLDFYYLVAFVYFEHRSLFNMNVEMILIRIRVEVL